MALAFIDGFDTHAASADALNRWSTRHSVMTYDATAGKFGGKAFKWATQGGAGDAVGLTTPVGILSGAEVYMGFWFKSSAVTGHVFPQSATLILFNDSTNAVNLSVTDDRTAAFGINQNGCPAFKNWRGSWAGWNRDGNISIADGQFHWIELYAKFDTASGVYQCYVDGVLDINYAGATASTTNPTLNKLMFSNKTTGGPTFTIDDVVIWDNSGSGLVGASFPIGPQKIVTLAPNGDTADKDFNRSTGSDNYALVDETVPNGDTDYVEAAVVGYRDLYDFGSLSETPAAVAAVAVTASVKNPEGGSINTKLVASSAGDVALSAAKAPSLTYMVVQHAFTVDPDTSTAWTESGINAAKFGLDVST